MIVILLCTLFSLLMESLKSLFISEVILDYLGQESNQSKGQPIFQYTLKICNLLLNISVRRPQISTHKKW